MRHSVLRMSACVFFPSSSCAQSLPPRPQETRSVPAWLPAVTPNHTPDTQKHTCISLTHTHTRSPFSTLLPHAVPYSLVRCISLFFFVLLPFLLFPRITPGYFQLNSKSVHLKVHITYYPQCRLVLFTFSSSSRVVTAENKILADLLTNLMTRSCNSLSVCVICGNGNSRVTDFRAARTEVVCCLVSF